MKKLSEWNPDYKSEALIESDGSDNDVRGFDRFSRTKELTIGAGSLTFRADGQGIWLGGNIFSSAPFRVSMAGNAVLNNATLTGTITATTGLIGGWTIGATSLSAGSMTIDSSAVLTAGDGTDHVRISGVSQTLALRSAGKNRLILGGADPALYIFDSDGNQAARLLSDGADRAEFLVGAAATQFQLELAKLTNGTAVIRPATVGWSLGTSTDYFVEIHYKTAVTHTPDIPKIERSLEIIKSVKRLPDGKIDKASLSDEIKHGETGIKPDALLMSVVSAMQNIEERLSAIEK